MTKFDPIGDWERKAIAEGRDPYAFMKEPMEEKVCRFCFMPGCGFSCGEGRKNNVVRRANGRMKGEM